MSTSFNDAGVTLFAFLSGAASLVVMIFWLVVGWRAMRAHEEIARALRELNEPR